MESTSSSLRELRRKSVRGGAVTIGAQAASTAIQLASTVVLARMLTPADYGVVAMVTAITSFAGLFRDLGLSSASIQKRDLTLGQQTNLFWLNFALGTALTLIVGLTSPLIAWFYGRPELTSVTITLSFNFVIGSLGAQHAASLVRNMQLERKAIAGVTAGVAGFIVAVVTANYGFSYWALVASSLTNSVVATLLLYVLSPFWPGIPKRGTGIRQMISYGAHVTAFDAIQYFYRNLDNILVGRFLGVESLGIYSRAYAILMLPIRSIRAPLSVVLFPALSKIQGSPLEFRRYFVSASEINAYLSLPLIGFLAISSDELVHILLGPEWMAVSPVFSWLTLPAALDAQLGLGGAMMLALGHVRKRVCIAIVSVAIMSTVFIVSVNGGILSLARAYAITSMIMFIPRSIAVFYGTPVSALNFVRCLFSPTLLTLCVIGCVRLLQWKLTSPPWTTLVYSLLLYASMTLALDAITKRFYPRIIGRSFALVR